MTSEKTLHHLIDVLYETVLEPNRLNEALTLCGEYVGASGTQLLTIDKKTNSVIHQVLTTAEFAQQSRDDYHLNVNPTELMIKRAMIQNALFNEWRCCHHFLDPNYLFHPRTLHSMGGYIDDNDDASNLLIMYREHGQHPFDSAAQQSVLHFSKHFQRAMRLQQYTQNLHAKIELGARAIDALALPMLIVNAKGVILHLNAGATLLLNNRDSGLTGKMGGLYATDLACKPKLTALLAQATAAPATGGAMFLSGDEPRQVFVTPLPAASPLVRDWQTPLALVLVTGAEKNQSALQLLGSLYDLSPAELRIASALLTGKSLEEYCQASGVTINTVRSQLKILFSKTSTRKQAELVALLSRAPPLHY